MDIKEIAIELRGKLKTEFPGYKFSVNISRFSGGRSMDVTLVSGPEDVFHALHKGSKEWSVNHYYMGEYDKQKHQSEARYKSGDYTGETELGCLLGDNPGVHVTTKAWDMMAKVCELAQGRNWNNSDIQRDYFDVNYYLHVAVGKWDKPYTVVPAKGGK